MGTGKWKLALSHTHSGNTKHKVDLESRKNAVHTDWENIFNNASSQVNTSPKIDLFATRLNTQLGTFVSYRPDPKCIVVNAFLLDWSKLVFYAFPHLSVRIESYRKYTKTRQKVLSLPQAGHLSLSTQA